MFRKNKVLFIIFMVISGAAFAQVGQSPYTIKGIGTINSLATARNAGMGGVGIGTGSWLYLNTMNPAMLTRNYSLTTFEAGLSLESRTLATEDQSDKIGSGGLDYLSIAFPVMYNRWTLNFGLSPYSTVNYDITTTRPFLEEPGTTSFVNFEGSGGLTQAYLATGVRVFKEFSVGLRANYLFGSIEEEITSSIVPDTVKAATYGTRFTDRTSFSDFSFSAGLSYRASLNEKKTRFLMAGLIYELETDLSAERLSTKSILSNTADGGFAPNTTDTTAFDLEGNYRLPSSFGVGLSYEKLRSNLPHYTIGADVKFQNWENFRNFSNEKTDLGKGFRFGVGGEWTPDATSAKAGTYFKRMTYRMGLQYEKTPIQIKNEQIDDFGINFGVSLPVSGASSVHTTFSYGQRGKIEDELVRERYFRISLGVTFNDRWFNKVKFD